MAHLFVLCKDMTQEFGEPLLKCWRWTKTSNISANMSYGIEREDKLCGGVWWYDGLGKRPDSELRYSFVNSTSGE
ncbi:hypothetical protein HPP92_021808 [Vanilla planifolia]|uniref:Uncharacterized protein n=1 Tax=Vanilla planifolia TaxID=51239 RepID=A0A835PW27_VANPL|nr:hypothetical protein HPP92_021808 [Vanilla planifolia]